MNTKIENTGLSATCVLATLNVSQSTFRKLDRKTTLKATTAAHAEDDGGRFNKLLLSKESFKPISKVVNRMRVYHLTHTLPYSDKGPRLLTTMSYFEYCQAMGSFQKEFETEVQDFLARYDEYVSKQETRLGDMFDRDDYPSAEVVQGRFSARIDISPVPSTSTLGELAGIPQEELDKIAANVLENEEKRTEGAMRDLWERLYGAVKHMQEKLSDKDAKFRNSLVGNLEELVDLLPSLNLTHDLALEKMYREVETELCTADVDDLRKDKGIRKDVADSAQEILDAMSTYF